MRFRAQGWRRVLDRRAERAGREYPAPASVPQGTRRHHGRGRAGALGRVRRPHEVPVQEGRADAHGQLPGHLRHPLVHPRVPDVVASPCRAADLARGVHRPHRQLHRVDDRRAGAPTPGGYLGVRQPGGVAQPRRARVVRHLVAAEQSWVRHPQDADLRRAHQHSQGHQHDGGPHGADGEDRRRHRRHDQGVRRRCPHGPVAARRSAA